ncbi:MAG: N-acetyl-gamma-glutamyl-phosphate reductase [Planctomycetes bacterium]|nr:N-acetyl-gamma-glutamyl-phosphate reductase [Planctomycetota bacterium]
MSGCFTVGLVGASGYAGQELCALLAGHPSLELTRCWSARGEGLGNLVAEGAPPIEAWDGGQGVDAVLLATPHGVSAPLAAEALEHGAKVLDLSADLRLADRALWEQTYGHAHPAPELLPEAVYGLTEFAREAVAGARLVANPGCYPTSVLLAARPLVEARLLEAGAPVLSDSKSGVSGAGRGGSDTTHYGNVAENLRAYGVGTHRHAPEIQSHLGGPEVVFVPHLLPCFRGILSTLYLTPAAGVDAAAVREALAARYANEPFVTVLPQGQQPELRQVQHTNRCVLGVEAVGPRVVVTSAIDNLLKGAAGQALQNLNLMLGLDETAGLEQRPGLA